MRSVVGYLAFAFMVAADAPGAWATEPTVSAQSFAEQGRDALRRGHLQEAADSLAAATREFEAAGDTTRAAETHLERSRVLLALGRVSEAHEESGAALRGAEQVDDASLARRARLSIAASLGLLGPRSRSREILEMTLVEARGAGDLTATAEALFELGNLAVAEGDVPGALRAYDASIDVARSLGKQEFAARAASNAALVVLDAGGDAQAQRFLDLAAVELAGAGPSHETADTLVRAGRAYYRVAQREPARSRELIATSSSLLSRGKDVAESIGDDRTASYALGYLAQIESDAGRSSQALALTRRAVFAAQRARAPESLYLWQRQTGRLLGATGESDGAIGSYRRAIDSLEPIRPALTLQAAPGKGNTQFEEAIVATHIELVDLLLRKAGSLPDADEQQPYLTEARDVMERLKAAEIQNYFEDECAEAARTETRRLEDLSGSAVVIYPIPLQDRVELLVSLPTGLRRRVSPVGRDRLTAEVKDLRSKLEKRTTNEYFAPAQELYRLLIAPLEVDLQATNPDTLVFVPYGILGTIPMATLHDGREFLVERYAIAITPGLSLTDPRGMRHDHIRPFIVGLTEPVDNFAPLPYVKAEAQAVSDLYGGTVLLDGNFVVPRVDGELGAEPFTVVHVASHGQFASNVEDTFLLTYDGRIDMNKLAQLVGRFRYSKEPLELLTLSACETAAGDARAALGLAGIAVRSGAKSALATLWSVDDAATAKLIGAFYQQLRDTRASKADALRQAQLTLLASRPTSHPAYWGPFLIINNWL